MFKPLIILFLVKDSLASYISEPQCSRFHYEEMTLEKMIKLEIFVKKMKDDLDAVASKTIDHLRDAESERGQLKLDMEKKMKEMESDMEKRINVMKNELEIGKEMTNSVFRRMWAIINSTNSTTDTPNIVFAVKKPVDRTLSNEIVKYGDIILNDGNGYDVTSGVFTAPMSGTYLFSVQFCLPAGDGIGYAVVSKGNYIKRGWLYDKDWTTCHGAMAVDSLNEGDTVSILCLDDATLQHGDRYWNTFSGALSNSLSKGSLVSSYFSRKRQEETYKKCQLE